MLEHRQHHHVEVRVRRPGDLVEHLSQPLALLRRSREEVDRVVLVAVQALKVAGKGPGAQLVLQDLVVRELFLSPLLESFLRSAAVDAARAAR